MSTGQPSETQSAPRAAAISVGDELVEGVYPDLNASAIARALDDRGVSVQRLAVVSDAPGALRDALLEIAPRVDLLVVSGGLGPTDDDRTRAEAAAAAGVELLEDAESLATIRAWFDKRGRRWSESNRVQALFPEGARVLENPVGTAPGFALRLGSAEAFFLPGPPRELQRLLSDHVVPVIEGLDGRAHVAVKRLQAFGLPEATLGDLLKEWMQGDAPRRCGITARKGVHTVTLRVEATSEAAAAAELASWEREVRERLDPYLYGCDGQRLQDALLERLSAKGMQVATAESCTGGLVARAITDVPGSSAVFGWGWVSYANEAKQGMLGVDEATLEAHGAVSAEVAIELAEGARRRAGAELGLSTTGIAGPEGGTEEKPVGLVWFGVSHGATTRAYRRRWPPLGRGLLREIAAREALFLGLRTLESRAPEADQERSYSSSDDQETLS